MVKVFGFDYSEHLHNAEKLETIKNCVASVVKKLEECAVVILDTCDRYELWLDGGEEKLKNLRFEIKPGYEKEDDRAALWLMELASGLHSPLFGEDQIISQVNKALSDARERASTDANLEMLFRTAVTTAKIVQSRVNLQVTDNELCTAVEKYLSPEDRKVLIIGTGAPARLLAASLLSKGWKVTITIRDIRKADELVPEGAQVITFDSRFDASPDFKNIVSASSGIGYTISESDGKYLGKDTVLIDLAPVCDIDPALKPIRICACDVATPKRDEAVRQASAIIARGYSDYITWRDFRHLIPDVKSMSQTAACDTLRRLEQPIKRLALTAEQEQDLRTSILDSAFKAFAHQLYSARDGKI